MCTLELSWACSSEVVWHLARTRVQRLRVVNALDLADGLAADGARLLALLQLGGAAGTYRVVAARLEDTVLGLCLADDAAGQIAAAALRGCAAAHQAGRVAGRVAGR